MFGAIHQHLKQYLIQNVSTHSRRKGTITMIATVHRTPFSLERLPIIFTARVTRLLLVI